MNRIDIINIIAIVLAPIVAVIIGQYLQNKEQKRNDKLNIFKILMRDRLFSWTLDSVNALNIIDVVFAEDKSVRQAWKELFDCLSNNSVDEQTSELIKQAKFRLLEEMADSLGYTDTISWETVQNPYFPNGLAEEINNRNYNQRLMQDAATELINMANRNIPSSYNITNK